MFCIKCGTDLPDASAFCNKCGTPVSQTQQYPLQAPPPAFNKPKGSKKPLLIIGIIAGVLAIAAVLLFIFSDSIFGSSINANDIRNLTVSNTSLMHNGTSFISISPSGKYAVYPGDGINIYLQIFENNNGRYVFYKDVYFDINHLYHRDEYFASSPIRTGEFIGWSNNEEFFAFVPLNGLITGINTDIFICDINDGRVFNLTGDENAGRTIFEGNFLFDYLPTWSDDDRTIYFARFGNDLGGNRVNLICSIPARGGNIANEANIVGREGVLTIFHSMIRRGNAIYYTTNSPDQNDSLQGIYKYQNGTTTQLVRHDPEKKPNPVLMDVSADGRYLTYYLHQIYNNQTFIATITGLDDNAIPNIVDAIKTNFESLFFVYDTQTGESTPIIPEAFKDAPESFRASWGTHNLLFSPCGNVLLHVEFDSYNREANIFASDVKNPNRTKRHVYTHDVDIPIGIMQNPMVRTQPLPRWLTNGFILMNSIDGVPFLLQVNMN